MLADHAGKLPYFCSTFDLRQKFGQSLAFKLIFDSCNLPDLKKLTSSQSSDLVLRFRSQRLSHFYGRLFFILHIPYPTSPIQTTMTSTSPRLPYPLSGLARRWRNLCNQLETRWVFPSYNGWVVLSIALAYFASATNTMVGWLYALSGLVLAMLAIAAWLPRRSLRSLEIIREPITPVSVGETVTLALTLRNQHSKQKNTLLQICEERSGDFNERHYNGQLLYHPIEQIAPGQSYTWTVQRPATRRGVFVWERIWLRSGAPLGLFWAKTAQRVPAKVVVYPQVLPLSRCPIIDRIGCDRNPVSAAHERSAMNAMEGMTRTLRAYRSGDPLRLVHWKSSARSGELRVRELETFNSGRDLVIAIDDRAAWDSDDFEQAVTAAASIYFYANRMQFEVQIWSAQAGAVRGHRIVLEALAAVQCNQPLGAVQRSAQPPEKPLIWLSASDVQLPQLPTGSVGMIWSESVASNSLPRVAIQRDRDLRLQLQAAV